MNELILKRAVVFSLIFGAAIGILSLIPSIIGFCLFALMFLSSVCVIIYMKKDEKYLSYLTNEQGAILGAVIGFFSTVGFFALFAPMVCILRMIFKTYYAYAIPNMLQDALWLFFVIIFMVGLIFAMTNSASGMGINWILSKIEKKPENTDARLDIEVND